MKRIISLNCLLLACLLAVSCQASTPTANVVLLSASETIPPPALTQTASLTPSLTASPVPSGPCDNPLMSLRVGNQWKYRSSSPMGDSQQIMKVVEWNEEQGLNALVEMKDLATGVITHDLVTCLEGGAIEDFPLLFVSMQMGDYVDGVFNTYYESGVYAPAYAQFVEQAWHLGWEAQYLSEEGLCLKNLTDAVALCFNQSSPIYLKFETQGGSESVTVPAGTFPQALVVSFEFTLATTITYPTFTTSAPLTVRTTQWYAPFIGLVRSQVDSAGVALMPGQESATQIESVVELIEFTPAP